MSVSKHFKQAAEQNDKYNYNHKPPDKTRGWQFFKSEVNSKYDSGIPKFFRRFFNEPHAGGTSLMSEAMSAFYVHNHYGGRLLATECQSTRMYKSKNKKPIDYIFSAPTKGRSTTLMFVSVVRCFPSGDFQLDVQQLIMKKIKALNEISICREGLCRPKPKQRSRRKKGRRGKRRMRRRKLTFQKVLHILTPSKCIEAKIKEVCEGSGGINIMVDICDMGFIYQERNSYLKKKKKKRQ